MRRELMSIAGPSGETAAPAADSRGPGAAADAIAARVAAEQLELLDRAAPTIAVNFINALVVVVALWDSFPTATLLGWLTLTGVVVILRIASVRRGPRSGAASVSRRLRHHVVGAAVSGSLWGAICIASALYESSIGSLVFLSFCVAGITAGAMTSLSPLRTASIAYLTTATGGLAVASYIVPSAWGVWMALLLLCYIVAMSFLAWNFNRAVLSTLRLRAENEVLAERLKTADAATETALRSKWETIAHLSHELRTPLNAVLGFSDLMKQEIFGPLGSARYVEYAGHVHEGGERALNLIESILNVSYAESGRLTLAETPVNLAALVGKNLASIAPMAASRHLTVTKSLDALPMLRADSAKLGQAIANLLSNAVNYTEAGGSISVTGTCAAGDGDCRLVIADTGIGMAKDDIPKALHPFVRLSSPLTHTVDGAGLGLPLAKRLIELHGGTLDIESAPGVGTTVTIRLPGARRIPAGAAAPQKDATRAA